MIKKGSLVLVILFLGFSIAVHAVENSPVVSKSSDLSQKILSGELVQKTKNIVILLDVSGSMGHDYKDQSKFDLAKSTILHMNETIPENIDLPFYEIRKFGRDFISEKDTPVYTGRFSRAAIEKSLSETTRGILHDSMEDTLDAASENLKSTQGNIVLIILSDGERGKDSSLRTIEEIKSTYGERLCVYPIQIGDDFWGKEFMGQLANKGMCGFAVNGNDVSSPGDMKNFVELVFLSKTPDSDGDGVYDTKDQCPDTPKRVSVDVAGCPLDTDVDGIPDYLDKCPFQGISVGPDGCPLDNDKDGVPDYLDKCPNTSAGTGVDDRGCPIIQDSDGDGVPNSLDKCPETLKGATVDKNGCPVDSDGDGIFDYLDKCPNTPAGIKADLEGCPIVPTTIEKKPDSDQDGVPDSRDLCPRTPYEVYVDQDGCPVSLSETKSFEMNIKFDTNSSYFDSSYHNEIKRLADFMKTHPGIRITIQGYADSVGSKNYNLWLSQRRANRVRQYLIDQFGIAPKRISIKGFGELKPIADNATKQGREKNRRAVSIVIDNTKNTH